MSLPFAPSSAQIPSGKAVSKQLKKKAAEFLACTRATSTLEEILEYFKVRGLCRIGSAATSENQFRLWFVRRMCVWGNVYVCVCMCASACVCVRTHIEQQPVERRGRRMDDCRMLIRNVTFNYHMVTCIVPV